MDDYISNNKTKEDWELKMKSIRDLLRNDEYVDTEQIKRNVDRELYANYDRYDKFWVGLKENPYDSEDIEGSGYYTTFREMAERFHDEDNVQFKEFQSLQQEFNLELHEPGYRYHDMDLKPEAELGHAVQMTRLGELEDEDLDPDLEPVKVFPDMTTEHQEDEDEELESENEE